MRLARARLGTTGPFPASAVLITDETGQFLAGRGVTGAMGRPSAVVAALADARGRTAGGTAYLTLEPDASEGIYDSEAGKLSESGIARAVIGALEPDRSRRGRGARALAEQGIDIVLAVNAPCERLIEAYATRQLHQRPFATAYLATSADGMIAGPGGAPLGLLTPDAQRWVDARRSMADAVLTSARTLSRQGLVSIHADGTKPLVVVSGRSDSPVEVDARTTVIVTAPDHADRAASDDAIVVPERNGRLDLSAMTAVLAERGVNALHVQAGTRLTESLISAELIDRFQLVESTLEVGRGGIPATPLGAIDARLRAAGFSIVQERLLGENRLRTFERTL